VADAADRDSYVVERSIDIGAPATAIFPHLVDFHEWTGWSPWEDLDPDLARTYSGAPGGVGAVYEWSGNRKAGRGRMEILTASAPELLAVQVDFVKPFKSSSTSSFALVPEESATRVTWSMVGRKTFMTKVMGVFTSMDKLVGPDFEKGLARLKALAES
jgi:hypothetical protein